MDTQEICRRILEDGGITLDHSRADAQLTSGFGVSRNGYEVSLPRDMVSDVVEHHDLNGYGRMTVDGVISYLSAYAYPNAYVGAWVDGDRVVFDVTDVYDDLTQAIHAGRVARQTAVFDFNDGMAIYLEEVHA